MEGEERVAPRSLLSLRIMFGKVLLTLGGLAAGASIGREGPTVQIGAAIMHAFHGRGPLQGEQQRRTLILAGGAAGIAAAFNTPLAGIMFAIEELSSHHVFKANSSTLITVVLSGLVSLSLLGNYTYFGTTSASLDWRSGALAIAGAKRTGLSTNAAVTPTCASILSNDAGQALAIAEKQADANRPYDLKSSTGQVDVQTSLTCDAAGILRVKVTVQRDVPTTLDGLGAAVIAQMPVIRQCIVARGANCADQAGFERKLLSIRKQAQMAKAKG